MKITVEFESMEEFQSYKGLPEQAAVMNTMATTGQTSRDQPHNTPLPVQAAQITPTDVLTTTPVVPPVAQTVPASAPAVSAPTEAVPTAAPSYSSDDLAKACITLMDQGRQKDLQNLLAQFGVTALPQLMKEQYGAFATALRGMGAPI